MKQLQDGSSLVPLSGGFSGETFLAESMGERTVVRIYVQRGARRGLEAVAESTGVDELILTAQVYDHAARLRSFELAGGLGRRPDGTADRVVEGKVRVARSPARP